MIVNEKRKLLALMIDRVVNKLIS